MRVEIFFQELCTRSCCKDGKHDFSQTLAIVESHDLNSKNEKKISIGRLIVFFRALKIECDCQVLSKFNPFQDASCVQNWYLAVPSDESTIDLEDVDFFAFLQTRKSGREQPTHVEV